MSSATGSITGAPRCCAEAEPSALVCSCSIGVVRLPLRTPSTVGTTDPPSPRCSVIGRPCASARTRTAGPLGQCHGVARPRTWRGSTSAETPRTLACEAAGHVLEPATRVRAEPLRTCPRIDVLAAPETGSTDDSQAPLQSSLGTSSRPTPARRDASSGLIAAARETTDHAELAC
jgi:hypothetical protein